MKRILPILLIGLLLVSFMPRMTVAGATQIMAVPAQPTSAIPVDYSSIDWDQSIALPEDVTAYQKQMTELMNKRKYADINKLIKRTVPMRSIEAMAHFHVPQEMQNLVFSYTQNGTKPVSSKDELKSKLKALPVPASSIPVTAVSQTPNSSETYFIDPKSPAKYKITKTIPVPAPKPLEIRALELKELPHAPIPEKYRYQFWDVKKSSVPQQGNGKLKSFLENILAFLIPTAEAQTPVPLITTYVGIEKNGMDNALLYLANRQNADGSFGLTNQFVLTAQTVNALAGFSRTDNDAFRRAIDFLNAQTPSSNPERARKIRLLVAQGQNANNDITALLANKNADGGFGFDANYASDSQSTMEVIDALTATQWTGDNSTSQAVSYLLSQIHPDGSISYTDTGGPSYYLINKALLSLYPYRTTPAIASATASMLNFLRGQYDETNHRLSLSTDAIDFAMIGHSFALYGTEPVKQKLIAEDLRLRQNWNGGFDDSVEATLRAMEVLAAPDLEITNVTALGALINRSPASFSITIRNKGYAASSGTDLYTFVDNVKWLEQMNLEDQGVPLPPNFEATINLNFPDTLSFIGQTNLKFYVEPDTDSNYDNNWRSQDFTFASSGNLPALPVYFIAHKWDISGSPAINMRWQVKTDPNRLNYIAMFREKGTNAWDYVGMNSNNDSGAFFYGGFTEGKTYETTMGVLHSDSSTVTYFNQLIDIRVSGNPLNYLGNATASATQDAARASGILTTGFSVRGQTDSNGEVPYTNIGHGKTAAYVDVPYLDALRTIFPISTGGSTTGIRLFSHLKEDVIKPVIGSFQVVNNWNYVVRNQSEWVLMAGGSDNVAVKEVDYYYWDPAAQSWIFIATKDARGQSSTDYSWYVPDSLIGNGYKLKAILRDFRGNESDAREWGPFRIINGAPPKFTVTSPNGGESWQLGSTQTIRWNTVAPNSVSRVRISAVYPNGEEGLQWNAPNTGSFSWAIPNRMSYAGQHIKIKVSGEDDLNYQSGEDSSDNEFSIVDASPALLSPWGTPARMTEAGTESSAGNKENAFFRYDRQGKGHLIYRTVEDQFGTPRIITEKLFYKKLQNGVWTEPALIYQKNWQTDAQLMGYAPMQNLIMEVDGAGNPHLMWQAGSYGGCETNNTQEIFMMHYDNGAWTTPENISNSANQTSRSPDFTADDLGNLYVVWLDGLTYTAQCTVSGTERFVSRVRSGTTKTWNTATWFSQGGSPSYPQIAKATDGKIHIAYADTSTNQIKDFYSTTAASWSIATIVASGDARYPSLIADRNGKLHLAYQEYYRDPATNSSWNRVMYVAHNGTSWGTPVEISQPAQGNYAEYPKVAVDAAGDPHVMYENYQSQISMKILMWRAQKNGIWLAPKPVSLQSQYIDGSGYSDLVFDGAHQLSAVWLSFYSRSKEVYLNHADLTKDYIPPPAVANVRAQPWPLSVRLTWDAYVNRDNDFDHFAVYRTTVSPPTFAGLSPITQISNVSTTKYIDLTTLAETNYSYAITAVDRSGNESLNTAWTSPVSMLTVFPLISLTNGATTLANGSNLDERKTLGIVALNSGSDLVLNVQNVGTAPLILNGTPMVQISGINANQFQIFSSAVSPIAVRASTPFTVRFTPTSEGVKTADLVIASNDLEMPTYRVTLLARGMADPFTKITTGPLVTDISSLGVPSFGDYDRDGFDDVFTVNGQNGGDRQNMLYHNDGHGSFTRVLIPALSSGTATSRAATWADVNNDGFPDLFVANKGQKNYLFMNGGVRSGTQSWQFTQVTTGPMMNDAENSMKGSFADIDGDGDLDLFVANWGQPNSLYKNVGYGNFKKIAIGAVTSETGWSTGGYFADYDRDGHPDLFVVRGNGQADQLFHNNGDGTFTKTVNAGIGSDSSDGTGAAWFDAENDGDLDLLVVNRGTSGENEDFYKNNGDGTFTRVMDGALVSAGGLSSGVTIGDIDRDGFQDIFISNSGRQGNFLFLNDGQGNFFRMNSSQVTRDRADSTSAAFTDYDKDGKPDLFIMNNNAARFLYRNIRN